MDDMLPVNKPQPLKRQENLELGEEEALEIAALLTLHNGGDVVVMDMRQINFWTDFFIIATVTSTAHLSGLERRLKEFTAEKGIPILRRSGKRLEEDEWRLLDLGNAVIHLMTGKTRAFYELERLWSQAPVIFKGENAGALNSEGHSSKSSSRSTPSP